MNLLGVVLSFAFVFAVIGVAQLLLKRGRISASVTRKVVHIGVAHFWLIAMATIDLWWVAIIPPLAFVFINLASYFAHLFPAMEHEERRKNLGTVYFPIALVIAALLTWAGPIPLWMGGVGMLVLGWADGLAALTGERSKGLKFPIYGNTKSLAGSLTMFAAAVVVTLVFLLAYAADMGLAGKLTLALATGALATVVELLTPFGLDNITVPIATMLFVYLV